MPETLEKAREAALRLIKFRPRSEEELRRRLEQKGFTSATIEILVSDLKRRKMIDDEKFSQYFVTGRLMAKPLGKQALMAQLKAKGVDPSLAAAAVTEGYAQESELSKAKEAALSRLARLQGLDKEATKRRLFGFLSRRGFSAETVYRVMREISL